MRSVHLEGIVLKRLNSGEADKLLTLFTLSRGKVIVLAKGTRRIQSRRAPHLELFNLVTLELHQGKGLPVVTEARSKLSFDRLKSDLTFSAYTFYLAEVLDRLLPEGEPHEEVFVDALETLKALDSSKPDDNQAASLLKSFVVKTLWNLGFLPRGQFPEVGVTAYLETIIERPMKSRRFIDKL